MLRHMSSYIITVVTVTSSALTLLCISNNTAVAMTLVFLYFQIILKPCMVANRLSVFIVRDIIP